MESMEKIGMAFCPKCGKVEIHELENVTINYPSGANKNPVAVIRCEQCHMAFSAPCDWADAVRFDFAGAKTNGFSFQRSPVIVEEEIEDFMADFDKEMDLFLSLSE